MTIVERDSDCHQMVVLARVITDMDQVTITAKGVSTLINILNAKDDNIIILTGE